MKTLNAETLRGLISYDPETGEFHWRGKPNGRVAHGAKAGTVNKDGYRKIQINGSIYQAGRLAVLYMTGEFPPKGFDVDHIDADGSKDDNRWANLRVVTRAQNSQNRKTKDSTRGVSYHKPTRKFQAQTRLDGKVHYFGLFEKEDEAVEFVQLFRAMAMPFSPDARRL